MEPPSGTDPHRGGTAPRRRRYSLWTLLAPAGAIVLYVGFFSALGGSCLVKDCKDDDGSASASTSESADEVNDEPRNARVKVKTGNTLGQIAAKYDLTEDELKACNPKVDAVTLQPGTYLLVSGKRCEDADKAPVGADPDPLAGDTTAVDTTKNGTAVADPSTREAGAGEAAGQPATGDDG